MAWPILSIAIFHITYQRTKERMEKRRYGKVEKCRHKNKEGVGIRILIHGKIGVEISHLTSMECMRYGTVIFLLEVDEISSELVNCT